MKSKTQTLPDETIIEVIKLSKGKAPLKKEMTIKEWNDFKKQPNSTYIAFQKGFSQFNVNTI